MTNSSTTLEPTNRTTPFAQVGIWWTSLDKVEQILLGLVALRVLIALVFMLDWLPLDRRFGWYLQHGGDQNEFLKLAISLIDGKNNLHVTLVAIGPALIYVPWILLIYEGAYGGEYLSQIYIEIVPALVVINGFIIGGLSVYVIGKMAQRLTKNTIVTVTSAALWAILPLLTYFAFFWHPEALLVASSNVPKVGWLNGLSDGPATFFIMLSVMILAAGLDDGKQQPFWRMFAVGAAMSAAIIFRVHIGMMVLLMLAFIVVAYGWRSLGGVAAGGILVYLPQAWYNTVLFGIPVTTGYISAHYVWAERKGYEYMPPWERLPFGPSHLIDLFQYHVGRRPWLLIVILLGLLVVGGLTYIMWKKLGWKPLVLLIAVPLVYLLPMMATWPFRDDVIRFSMPAYPFFVIMVPYFVLLIYQRIRQGAPEPIQQT